MPDVRELTLKQIDFEIRFASGKALASLFIAAHAKGSVARLKAINELTRRMAARSGDMTVSRVLPDGYGRPLFGS
jgi:hypothetical protein